MAVNVRQIELRPSKVGSRAAVRRTTFEQKLVRQAARRAASAIWWPGTTPNPFRNGLNRKSIFFSPFFSLSLLTFFSFFFPWEKGEGPFGPLQKKRGHQEKNCQPAAPLLLVCYYLDEPPPGRGREELNDDVRELARSCCRRACHNTHTVAHKQLLSTCTIRSCEMRRRGFGGRACALPFWIASYGPRRRPADLRDPAAATASRGPKPTHTPARTLN